MKQLLLPETYNGEKTWNLKGPDVHYLKNVLRLNKGSTISGIDHKAQKWDIYIEEIDNKECRINLKKKILKNNSNIELNLYQCIPKGKKFDRICREATECGVSNIVPVSSVFSIPKVNQEQFSKKNKRYEGIIKEAIQQSGSTVISRLTKAIKLENIDSDKTALKLFFHQEKIDNNKLQDLIKKSPCKKINMLIGPEGGLSAEEINILISKGFKPVYLGNNVLRAETAAIYAIAAVKTIILENLDA